MLLDIKDVLEHILLNYIHAEQGMPYTQACTHARTHMHTCMHAHTLTHTGIHDATALVGDVGIYSYPGFLLLSLKSIGFFIPPVAKLGRVYWNHHVPPVCMSSCPSLHVLGLCPEDTFRTTHAFVNKHDMVVHDHELECHIKEKKKKKKKLFPFITIGQDVISFVNLS